MLFRLRVATALAGGGGKQRWRLEVFEQELVAEQGILSRLAGKVAWSNDLGHQFGVALTSTNAVWLNVLLQYRP